MIRTAITFRCRGALLAGALDLPTAPGSTGLLIVSGGNEPRGGPWGSQTRLSAAIAAAGCAVMRFDRRGIGDSEGTNGGFESAAPDIAAALRAFRAAVPTLQRIVAYGNCDAASALMLAGGAGCDGLILANPWTFDASEATLNPRAEPAQAMTPRMLRAHYLRRLLDPAAVLRLLTGKVKIGQLSRSIKSMARPAAPRSILAQQLEDRLDSYAGAVSILLAERDRTAQAFAEIWNPADPRLHRCPGASHSFVEPSAQTWLLDQILAVLQRVAQLD